MEIINPSSPDFFSAKSMFSPLKKPKRTPTFLISTILSRLKNKKPTTDSDTTSEVGEMSTVKDEEEVVNEVVDDETETDSDVAIVVEEAIVQAVEDAIVADEEEAAIEVIPDETYDERPRYDESPARKRNLLACCTVICGYKSQSPQFPPQVPPLSPDPEGCCCRKVCCWCAKKFLCCFPPELDSNDSYVHPNHEKLKHEIGVNLSRHRYYCVIHTYYQMRGKSLNCCHHYGFGKDLSREQRHYLALLISHKVNGTSPPDELDFPGLFDDEEACRRIDIMDVNQVMIYFATRSLTKTVLSLVKGVFQIAAAVGSSFFKGFSL